VTVNTVEDLINELKLLPPKLAVKKNDDGVDVVIFNRDSDAAYIGFEPGGEWRQIVEG